MTPREVRVLGPLMALRSLPSRFTRQPLELGASDPVLAQFLGLGFIVLAENPGVELVLGAIGRFWSPAGNRPLADVRTREDFVAFDKPGYAKAALNLIVHSDGVGSRISTETRVLGTDAAARRRFRLYWLIIGSWSALIRRSLLGAIRRRLEPLAGAEPPSALP